MSVGWKVTLTSSNRSTCFLRTHIDFFYSISRLCTIISQFQLSSISIVTDLMERQEEGEEEEGIVRKRGEGGGKGEERGGEEEVTERGGREGWDGGIRRETERG